MITKPEALDETERMEVLKRLQDYHANSLANPEELRAELVQRWKNAHPEAAAESSQTFHPLIKAEEYRKFTSSTPDEFWFNDIYQVTVRRHNQDPVFKTDSGGMIQLGISSHD